jgi:transcription initiation factor TFIIIB Brf1 subunit/transcription initiation factor TFIIB
MPPAVIQKVNELWKIIEEHSELWQAKKPAGVAAALIYLAGKTSGNVRTQAEVCDVAKISEVTLRGLIKIIDALMVRASESNMN